MSVWVGKNSATPLTKIYIICISKHRDLEIILVTWMFVDVMKFDSFKPRGFTDGVGYGLGGHKVASKQWILYYDLATLDTILTTNAQQVLQTRTDS